MLRPSAGAWLGAAGGAALAAIAFGASGGLELGRTTIVEVALTIACGVALAAAILAHPPVSWHHGLPSIALMAALGVLTAASVASSVDPAASWVEASRTFAYAMVFATAVAGARTLPHRWPSVLGAIILAGVLVCGYALLTKVFPAALSPDEPYARLRDPYGYWNGVGLTAALAVPPCLWLGARRSGHAALNALAYPALGILLVALMLSYSRGALLALLLGCAFWFGAVPLRLRGAAVLGAAATVTGVVVAWVFTDDALTLNQVDLGLRSDAGDELGILLLAMLLVLGATGLWATFRADRRPLGGPTRRAAGTAILVALALVPVSLAVALAASPRGLGGSLSHDWRSLTDPHARTPPNDPSRLTAIGSVRARYWNEALKIFQDHPVTGVGAGGYATARLRYRQDTLDVQHAHGYVVQTLADMGLLGLVVSLALLAAWLIAAFRSSAPFGLRPPGLPGILVLGRRRGVVEVERDPVDAPTIVSRPPPDPPPWPGSSTRSASVTGPALPGGGVAEPAARSTEVGTAAAGDALAVVPGDALAPPGPLLYTPERIGLLTLIASALVFGAHSLIDWTWFIPGTACVGLVCAGWVAGRGPFELPTPAIGAAPAAIPMAWRTRLGAIVSRRARPRPELHDPAPLDPALVDPAPIDPAHPLTRRGWRSHLLPTDPTAPVVAGVVLIASLVLAWSQWQPLRSARAGDRALAALDRHDTSAARSQALAADRANPLSVGPLFDLAVIETTAGNLPGARSALQRAVHRQPSNPQTWLRLSDFDLNQTGDAKAALNDLRPALYLDPRSFQVEASVLTVLRRLNPPPAPPAPAAPLNPAPSGAVPVPSPPTSSPVPAPPAASPRGRAPHSPRRPAAPRRAPGTRSPRSSATP